MRVPTPARNFTVTPLETFKVCKREKESYSISNTTILNFYERLQTIIDHLKDQAFTEANTVEEKVWRYYDTCLTAPVDTDTPIHYLELVSPDVNLTWPQFTPQGSTWPQEEFQWLHTLAHLRRYGLENSVIRMNVGHDYRDSSKFRVYLNKPEVAMFEDVPTISDLLISVGVDTTKAPALANKLVLLDEELQEFAGDNYDFNEVYTLEELQNEDYTLEELKNRTGLQLDKYLEIVFGRSFDSSFEVTVWDIEYLENLEEILQKYDKDVVASYLMVQFVRFMTALDGSGPEGDCLDAVQFQMEEAGDLLYEDHYLGPEKLQKYTAEVQRIFKAVTRSFLVRLEKNHLHLSTEEVAALKERLETMTVTVGILPGKDNHRRFVTDFYQGLELDSEPDFGKAQLQVLELRTRRALEQLDGAFANATSFFLLYDEIANANPVPWLEVSNNTIFLGIEMLQEPVLATEGHHDVFKMSLLGYLFARKLMERFSPAFVPYDGKGNYGKVLDGLKDYPSYADALACLNATETENLPKRVIDVVSLGIAYDAYFGENSEFDQKQPEFTEVPLKQLFLLSFAQWFSGDAQYLDYGKADSDELRLHQAIQNLPDFAEAFSCPTSSVLNPADRCQVW